MSQKNIVSVILLVLILALAAVSFSGVTGSIGEPKPDVTILYKPQIISAIYKVYGRPELKFWVAKTIVKNVGTAPIKDLEVSYKIEGYADWSVPIKYDEVPPGGGVVDLYYPDLPKKISALTSPTPATLYVKITYNKNGKAEEILEKRKINILGLHDFVFSSLPPEENTGSYYDVFYNSPMLAAWVTPTDPVVREFSDIGNKLAGGAGATLSDQEAWKSMQGVWNALVLRGMTYKTEPTGYWTGKFSEYIKFPRDTILDGEGTCVDLAIMYASLMLAQGLKTYIVLVPGHAFPIIELPSGRWVPVETTALNSRVSLGQAVSIAVRNWQQKFSKGPYILVDVTGLQAAGITPPELPPLPPDILEKKGIKQRIEAMARAGMIPAGGGGEGGLGAPPGTSFKEFQNELFSVDYPEGWSFDQGTDDEGHYVYWESPDGEQDLYISWRSFQGSVDDYVSELESLFGEVSEVSKQNIKFQGCPAQLISYSWEENGTNWKSVDLFVVCNGIGYHVAFEAEQDYWDEGTAVQLANYLIYSFNLRG